MMIKFYRKREEEEEEEQLLLLLLLIQCRYTNKQRLRNKSVV